jgi:hypothetical protein
MILFHSTTHIVTKRDGLVKKTPSQKFWFNDKSCELREGKKVIQRWIRQSVCLIYGAGTIKRGI